MFLWHMGDTGDDNWSEDDDDSGGSSSADGEGSNSSSGDSSSTNQPKDSGEHKDSEGPRPDAPSQPEALASAESADNPLYEAIRKFHPDNVAAMQEMVSVEAREAMKRTLTGVLGALPAEVFEVQVSSERDGLKRLLFSSLMTGYSLRNAEFRMTLSEGFSDIPTSPMQSNTPGATNIEEPSYMSQVPSRTKVSRDGVNGTVSWWDIENQQKREMEASRYLSKLEAEIELLRDKIAASDSHSSQNNKVLNYMRTLSIEKIASLQQGISSQALDAMKRVVGQLLGVIPNLTYSISQDYLAQLTYWCLMVGYNVRDLEKRQEILKTFNTSESVPARNVGEQD